MNPFTFPPIWRRIFQELRPYKKLMAVVVFTALIVSSIQPISVRLSQEIIDSLQNTKSTLDFGKLPFWLVLLFIISGLAKYFHNCTRRYVSEKIIYGLRQQIFERYLQTTSSQLDKSKTGELLSYMQNDLSLLNGGLDTWCDLIKEPITFIGLMISALYFDWRLTCVTLLVAPVVVQLFSRTGKAVKRYGTRNVAEFGELVSTTQEALVGHKVVKLFQLENELTRKFSAINFRYFSTIWKSIRVQELATPTVELVGALVMAAVVYYAGHRIASGALTAGQLVAFVISIGLAQMPIKLMNNSFLRLRSAEAAAARVFKIIDSHDPHDAHNVEKFSENMELREIEFSHVGLTYGERPVLKDVTFKVKKGQTVALIGESGGGKSSIVSLLPRLYDVSSGEVRVNGTNIKQWSLRHLRSMISVVSQDTFLFHDTLEENIRYGKLNSTPEEIKQAAKLAHCADFIERSDLGMKTIIGDRGMSLSGGERQRLAIARAFLRNSPILILDEATSNLDVQSEQKVQSALAELMKDRTCFVIAHRLYSIVRSDLILVISDGKIIESGTHADLLKTGNHYFELLSRAGISVNPDSFALNHLGKIQET